MNRRSKAFLALAALLAAPASARAQLDLLRPLKSTRPNVVVALDLSSRMQRDGLGRCLDPVVFEREGQPYETSLGVDTSNTLREYRRWYTGLEWLAPGGEVRAVSRAIETTGDRTPGFAGADGRTLIGRASTALLRVIAGNGVSARFGLITTRQVRPRIDTSEWLLLETTAPAPEQPTDTGTAGRWRAGISGVGGPGVDGSVTLIPADARAANADLTRLLQLRPGAAGALLPAGLDGPGAIDAPLGLLVDDLQAEALRLVAADDTCRNTVAVLLAAGSDPSLSRQALGQRAASLLSVAGRRVPVYVVALAPDPAEASELRQVAAQTGGRYFEIDAATIERVNAAEPVPEIVAALNIAVQHSFAAFRDFNEGPSAAQPYGPPSFFATTGPVVGTVNLENAVDDAGALLPATRVVGPGGVVLPQRSNVMFTLGYELPGFAGRLSAYRVYRPVVDVRQATGYRFSSDGTRLWTAAVPPPDDRNIFTILPGTGLVPFRSGYAAALAPFLRVSDPASLVDAVRALPLGPTLNSTPALLEPPSMRFGDPDYPTFVEANRRRRALLFVGANDGMLHAFDARTGLEVWALIPFNLLPKLRRLKEGRPIDAFPYFVEGSPRISDVKILDVWRTYLFIGEGPGGTFYQALDVTLDDIGSSIPPDADPRSALLAWFANAGRIPFKWSYPRYEQFDPGIPPDGDLAASSTDAEKSVGETWSTPAIGRAGSARGPFVVIVGSGQLPRSREQQAQRGGVRAGTRLYVMDAATGQVRDQRDVGSDGVAEEGDSCEVNGCSRLKNAIHADPLAASDDITGAITRVYAGDLDGRIWRFDLSPAGGDAAISGGPRLLLAAGGDQPIFGTLARLAGTAGQSYLFIGTGSDLLPRWGSANGYRLVGLAEGVQGVTSQFDRLLRTAVGDGVDEAVSGAPVVAGGVVFFATTASQPGSGCNPAEASVYALTIKGGAAYDANVDRRRDQRDTPLVSRLRVGRSGAPVVADRHLFVSAGSTVQVFGDPEGFGSPPGAAGLRVISWREVR